MPLDPRRSIAISRCSTSPANEEIVDGQAPGHVGVPRSDPRPGRRLQRRGGQPSPPSGRLELPRDLRDPPLAARRSSPATGNHHGARACPGSPRASPRRIAGGRIRSDLEEQVHRASSTAKGICRDRDLNAVVVHSATTDIRSRLPLARATPDLRARRAGIPMAPSRGFRKRPRARPASRRRRLPDVVRVT